MNSLSCATCSGGAAKAEAAAATLASSLGVTSQQVAVGGGAVLLSQTGEVLLGQAKQGDVSLFVLGTVFAEAPGWKSATAPIENADASAQWLLARYRKVGLAFLDGVVGQFAAVLHDDHQAANAAVLEKAGAAWVVRQDALEANKLARMLEEIFSNPTQLAARAEAAHKLGHPDAAARLADLVETLGTRL